MADREPGRVQSVCKAMDLLSCLAEARTPLTLGELSRRTGMPKATVHGLLSALRSSAVVEQSDDPKAFFASPETDRAKAFLKSFDYE